MILKSVNEKCDCKNCKCLCARFAKRGIRELHNKSANHFLSGDFVLQNAYLANTYQRF